MFDTTLPRPPRLDVKLLFIIAMLVASGLTFFAVCSEAHANGGVGGGGGGSMTGDPGSGGAGGSVSIGAGAGGVASDHSNNLAGVGGSATVMGGQSGAFYQPSTSRLKIEGNHGDHPGSVSVTIGSRESAVFNENGTEFHGDVAIDGDPVVTFGMLGRLLTSFNAQYVTRQEIADHEQEYAVGLVFAAVGGGAAGAGLFSLLGVTLFARAFAMRRWTARAHRSLLRRLASDPNTSPMR